MIVFYHFSLPGQNLEILRKNLPGEKENIFFPLPGPPSSLFCHTPSGLILPPDIPLHIRGILENQSIPFRLGLNNIGEAGGEPEYPAAVRYNAVVAAGLLVHRLELTDPVILESAHCLRKIPVMQAFTRNYLIPLSPSVFLTSDEGIFRELKRRGLGVFFFGGNEIARPGNRNGGIGGASGVWGNTLFLNGSLKFHGDGERLRLFLEKAGFVICELGAHPLTDLGGIVIKQVSCIFDAGFA